MNAHKIGVKYLRPGLPVWIAIILMIAFVTPASAQGIVFGSSIPAGEEVNQDVILIGTDVNIDGNVHGDVLALGQNVSVKGNIDGSLVTAGQSVNIDGAVGGSTYAAALELMAGETARFDRNLYFTGLLLTLPQGSQVGNNLYLATVLTPSMQGNIGGEVRSVGPADLIRFIISRMGNEINLPWIGPVQLGPGTFQPQSSVAQVSIAAPAVISWSAGGFFTQGEQSLTQTGGIDQTRLQRIILNWLRSYLTLLIFALLFIWLIPRYLNQSAETVRTSALRSTGWGLVAVLVGYTGSLLVFVVILLIGAFLIYLTLYGLGFITVSLGLGLLGVAFTLFTLLVSYGSKVIVAFLIGYLILYRGVPGRTSQRIFSALLGLLIYTILASIPILRWVVGLVATLLGMGALWIVFIHQRKAAEGSPEEMAAPADAPLPASAEVGSEDIDAPEEEAVGDQEGDSEPEQAGVGGSTEKPAEASGEMPPEPVDDE